MRVVHLNTNRIPAGATMSALRLHNGLRKSGVDSRFLCEHAGIERDSVRLPGLRVYTRLRAKLDRTISKVLGGNERFILNQLPSGYLSQINACDADIFNLHIMRGGFLSAFEIAQLGRPIVWTIHDMWPLTGGCTYSGDCRRYIDKCGACSVNGSKNDNDLSRLSYLLRRKQWAKFRPVLVAPSKWMGKCIRESSLMEKCAVHVIPYGLDLDIWKPRDKAKARQKLNLSTSLKIVLFGAVNSNSDRRKGKDLLFSALGNEMCQKQARSIQCIVFGGTVAEEFSIGNIRVRQLAHINNEAKLADLYSAADVFVAPSREDNLPNTVLESLACGTPVVAFSVGGMPDMILHRTTGYLADPYSIDKLAEGILWFANNTTEGVRAECSRYCKARYSDERQAFDYINLYKTILGDTPKRNEI